MVKKSGDKKAVVAKKTRTASVSPKTRSSIGNMLILAQLRAEKCELKEAQVAYTIALQEAKTARDLRATMEALSGLLRLAGEALDESEVRRLERELDSLMDAHPKEIPAMAWYCKGVIARQGDDILLAQRYVHRYLRLVRRDPKSVSTFQMQFPEEAEARGWVMLTFILWQRNCLRRTLWLAEELLRRYETRKLRGINGMLYLTLGTVAEKQKRYDTSLRWFQRAHIAFLSEHNWYYHLYVLYGYARLARLQKNYAQAYLHLDLIDKAASGPEFGLLRREIATERCRLEQDAVDLLIDSRQCIIKTRAGGEISLGKQYVLLHILEVLSVAHGRDGDDRERGLSKAEIIERVWSESYRPEAHDNKLYYNINRLRKLIEPDIKNPQYLLNWKEGYRLAPGLRIHFVGGRRVNEIGRGDS